MQRTMQADCAVFRTERTLAEGVAKIDAVYKRWPTSASPTAA
jgi:succinate dehydrogenase / fumarate reductase flavoprotein subunit